MRTELTIVARAFRFYMAFVFAVLIAFLPLITALLIHVFLYGTPAVYDHSQLTKIALQVLHCNPLIWILSKYTGYSFSDPMSSWDWKQNVMVLMIVLPSSAILRVVLSRTIYVATNMGRRGLLIATNPKTGKLEGTALTAGICLSTENAWIIIAHELVERFYSEKRFLLIALTGFIILAWVGFETKARFREHQLLSALIDLLDSLFELPVLASLSALLWWFLTLAKPMTWQAILCLAGVLLIMVVYGLFSKGKLPRKGISVPLYYGVQVVILVGIVFWWKQYMV